MPDAANRCDERLLEVARAVRPGSVVADIGTDHGYLVCHLVASGKCPRAFACDIREKPLQRAREHIAACGLADRITCLCTDGLRGLPTGEIDDFVLAGMGGELIAGLLAAEPAALRPDKRFILQPMTKAGRLRHSLYRQGFELLSETGVRAGGFVYSVMRARHTGRRREIGDVLAYTGLLDPNHEPSRHMLELVRDRLLKKAAGLRAGGCPDRALHYAGLAGAIREKIG